MNAPKENRSGPKRRCHGSGVRRPSTGSRVTAIREPGSRRHGRRDRGKHLPSGSKSWPAPTQLLVLLGSRSARRR